MATRNKMETEVAATVPKYKFDVVAAVPTEREFTEEMERRYAEMLAGNYVEHELVEE